MNCNKYKWIDNNILFDKNIPYRKSMSAMYHKCKTKQCYIHKLYHMHIGYHRYKRVQCYMHIDYRKYNLKRYCNRTSYHICNLKRYCNHIDYRKCNLKQYHSRTSYHRCMRVLYYNHTNNHMSNKFYVLHKNIHTYKCSLNYSLSKTKYYKYTHVQKYTKCYINSY